MASLPRESTNGQASNGHVNRLPEPEPVKKPPREPLPSFGGIGFTCHEEANIAAVQARALAALVKAARKYLCVTVLLCDKTQLVEIGLQTDRQVRLVVPVAPVLPIW